MKQKLVIWLLVTIVSLQTFDKLLIMTGFYIQQDYIVNNLCINRFDKIPVCFGQCVLTEKLIDTEKKDHPTTLSKYKEVVLFVEQASIMPVFDTTDFNENTDKKRISENTSFIPREILYAIFHPPRCC